MKWLTKREEKVKFLLHPESAQRLSSFSQTVNEVVLLIGAEGGFSPAEVEQAKQKDFMAVQLGPRILRTETAALATIAALQTRWGDFI